jgi:AhpD family alkylhydroperoxidase
MVFSKSLVKGTLDPKLRELAYLKTSLINGCAYCAEGHKGPARRAGVTGPADSGDRKFFRKRAFSDLEKLVLVMRKN